MTCSKIRQYEWAQEVCWRYVPVVFRPLAILSLVNRHAKGTPYRRAKRTPLVRQFGLVQVANRRAPRARVARLNGACGGGAWEVPVYPPGQAGHGWWNAAG